MEQNSQQSPMAMVVRDHDALPAISAQQMVNALETYRELQHALDKAMPEQIMQLEGKPFRKKGYWRAISLAFKLNVQLVSERREVSGQFNDGRDNFGWIVTYKATHPSGREMNGDGSCFAIEKARRFKCPHPENPDRPGKRTLHFPHNTCPDYDPSFSWRTLPSEATEHNVRSHAHTRAFNRAVSNLVGFGEVSAEEVERDERGETDDEPRSSSTSSSTSTASSVAADGVTTIKSVETRDGKTGNRKWTLYTITCADGRSGTTFNKAHAEEADRARQANARVKPLFVDDEKGTAYKGLDKGAAADEQSTTKSDAQKSNDEPVSGPERILTIREVKTELGARWVIQTDKRELVTDDASMATLLTKAKDDKLRITPEFEVVPRKSGVGTANKITDFAIEQKTGDATNGAHAQAHEAGDEQVGQTATSSESPA